MENKTQNGAPKFKSVAELRAQYESEASSAKERIKSLFDEGTFVEIGTFAHSAAAELSGSEGELEGVICGYGAVDGRLVFAFAQDYSRMKGALGAMHAKKICSLYELATKNGAPVIGIFDSAGAFVLEGVEALAGYGKVMRRVADASGVIPQIALVAGPCGGAMAAVAEMFDIVLATKGASLYVNPPFIVNNLDKSGKAGSPETASAAGLVSTVLDDDASALAYVRRLLSYIPQNSADGAVYASTNDEINRLTPDVAAIIANDGYAMTDVISAISDDAAFLELYNNYAPELVCGFVTLGGMVVGVVANQPSENGGKLTPAAADKAAKFVSFCDCFAVPLLTLVDTEGYEVSAEAEKADYSKALARLAAAYSSSDNAKVTVVLGRAYGAAYTLMGSKSIGADIALAADCAKISAMPTRSAVAFAWGDKVDDNAKRSELEAEWDSVMASPLAAAKAGEIDDIISLDELRQRTAAAFEMLFAKNTLKLKKRHANLPL